jgi:hypothetical protein
MAAYISALVRLCLSSSKNALCKKKDFPSHQICDHSLVVLCGTNVLSLISQRLDNYYQIQTKCYSIATVNLALLVIKSSCNVNWIWHYYLFPYLLFLTTTKMIYINAPFFLRGNSILSRPYKWCPNEPSLQIHLLGLLVLSAALTDGCHPYKSDL